jgi:hypothetical protein
MQLNNLVEDLIYNYPLLYKSYNYTNSRLRVLNHLFLVIGNGYEWDITRTFLEDKDSNLIRSPYLDKEYFSRKLYSVNINDKRETVLQLIKDVYHYTIGKEILFECEESRIEEINNKVSHSSEIIIEARSGNNILIPYSVFDSSYISEIYKGNCQGNTIYLNEDWLVGAIDICQYALNFYRDEEKFKHHYDYKSISKNQDYYAFTRFRQDQIEFFEKFIFKYGI